MASRIFRDFMHRLTIHFSHGKTAGSCVMKQLLDKAANDTPTVGRLYHHLAIHHAGPDVELLIL